MLKTGNSDAFFREKCLTKNSELYRAVNELKEEVRIPVILYYMEEFNIREIAQILEISEGAVQKRLVRARKTLKKKIQLEEIFI